MKILQKLSQLFLKDKIYHYSNEYYDSPIDKYSSIETYINLAYNNGKQVLSTTEEISFTDNPNFKKNKKKYLRKKYGKPYFKVVNNFQFGKITVLFYRIVLGFYKARLELHFYQNSLIMYNYTFLYLNNENENKQEKNHILEILKEKYKLHNDIVPNECYIKDRKNTIIVFNNNVNLSLNYVGYVDSDIHNQMKSLIDRDDNLKKTKTEKSNQELLKKL